MIFRGDHTIFHLGLFNFCAIVLSKVAKRKLAVLDDKVYTLHTFILTVVSQNRMHCRISPLVGVMRRTVIGRRSLVFLSVRKRTLDGAFSYSLHIDTPFIKTPHY